MNYNLSKYILHNTAILAVIAQVSLAQSSPSNYQKKRGAMIATWKSAFGEQIDFSSDAFFNNMSAVGVKALQDFKSLEGVKLKSWLSSSSDRWMQKFFVEKFQPKMKPQKYYLQKASEPSILLYQWQVDNLRLTMYESVSAVLVEITHGNASALELDRDTYAELMTRVFKVGIAKDMVAEAFKLNGAFNEGTVITNAPSLEDSGFFYRDWQKGIITFGSKKGICVLMLKAAPGRADPNLPNNPNWLKKGLVFPKYDK